MLLLNPILLKILLLNTISCIRVIHRKNTKDFITRSNNKLTEKKLSPDSLINQRVKIHNRKLYFYSDKLISFAVANNVEVQLTEEPRQIGFFGNRRVVDAFHLQKNEDKKMMDAAKAPRKRDKNQHKLDDRAQEFVNKHHYQDKPPATSTTNTKDLMALKENRIQAVKPVVRNNFDLDNKSNLVNKQPDRMVKNYQPQREYTPLRDRNSPYNYDQSNAMLDNKINLPNNVDIPQPRYKDNNEPYYDTNNIYGNKPQPWYDSTQYKAPEYNIPEYSTPDYRTPVASNIELPYIPQSSNINIYKNIKDDVDDKAHNIESDSSYDGDDTYGMTKLDMYIEELKNGYFKLSNSKNCITFFENKYIFGMCIRNDPNQEFKLENADEILNKMKEDNEKKIIDLIATTKTNNIDAVTVTVTALPTTTVSKKNDEFKTQDIPLVSKTNKKDVNSKPLEKTVKVKEPIQKDSDDDFFDRNSGDLLEALQKNFSFKNVPF